MDRLRPIDLTHKLAPSIPSWTGDCGFRHEVIIDYDDCSTEVKFRIQKIMMDAGIGTHLDAPAHCCPDSSTVDSLLLDQLITHCVVIDVSLQAHARFSVTPQNILDFEKKYHKISKNSFVIFHTGWSQYWSIAKKYHNNYLFPSISKAAAELLVDRNIAGLGIDTLSPDRPTDGFPVHQIILGTGKYIVENVAHSQHLPPTGCLSLALPIPFVNGTEAPIRLIGLIQER